MSSVEIVSPLQLGDCVARLREATDEEGWPTLFGFGSRPVVGQVSRQSVRLRKRITYGNAFQIILVGKLEKSNGGTVFRGKAGVRAFVTIFMRAWFCGVVLLGSLIFAIAVGEMERSQPLLLIVAATPPLLLMFGFGLMRFSQWLARDEEKFLVDFLVNTIGEA